jgi:hypothetical protein
MGVSIEFLKKEEKTFEELFLKKLYFSISFNGSHLMVVIGTKTK